jgi:lysophospholipase
MPSEKDPRRTRPAGAEFGQWRAPDGWLHRRMDWPQRDPDKARGSLLFAGGRGDFIEKYLEAYTYWHAAGWNVAAFDWRSQGASQGDRPGGHLTSFNVLIDDLAALIADWRSRRPGPHAAIAHARGGHMLLRTLVERKPALDAAVLVAPMLRVNSAPLSPALAPWITDFMCLVGLGGRPLYKVPKKLADAGSRRQYLLTGCSERYADELWWWGQEPGFQLGSPSWSWMRAAYRSSAAAFRPARLAKVDVPLLLLGTERDRLVSPEAIRDAARWIPGAELNMYPNAGHDILREADPIRLDALATIDEFLSRHAR